MATIRCNKCHASLASLYLADRYLENGQHLEEIVCRICGQIIAGREVPRGRQRKVIQPAKPSRPRNLPVHPCAIQGCSGTYSWAKLPLCEPHRDQLKAWQKRIFRRDKRTQPPVQLVNGHWIEQGAAILGIPMAHPNPHHPLRREVPCTQS